MTLCLEPVWAGQVSRVSLAGKAMFRAPRAPEGSAGDDGAGQGRREPPGRAERERDGDRAEPDPERAHVEPEVAAERIVEPPTRPRPERHTPRGHGTDRAEDGPHGAGAEVLAHEDRVEGHRAAVGEAEHDRDRVEARE